MKEAFEKYLKHEVIIPEHFDVMGAIGAGILAKEEMDKRVRKTAFYGWDIPDMKFKTSGFECDGCSNICEIVEIRKNEELIARWGSKCGKWDSLEERNVSSA
jgi:hypothetical protein